MNWQDHTGKRWAVAVGAAFGVVAVLALIIEQVVEQTFGVGYTIHWLETVPFVVLLVAFLLQRMWRTEHVVLVSEDAEE